MMFLVLCYSRNLTLELDIQVDNKPNIIENIVNNVSNPFQREAYKISHKIISDQILDDESVDNLEELKTSGMSDLQSKGKRSEKRVIQTKELLSHVPQELSVVKYGYVDNRVLGMLENILDHGGFISAKSLNAISIVSMELEADGKDINIHYRLKRSDSLVNDDDFSIFRTIVDSVVPRRHNQ